MRDFQFSCEIVQVTWAEKFVKATYITVYQKSGGLPCVARVNWLQGNGCGLIVV